MNRRVFVVAGSFSLAALGFSRAAQTNGVPAELVAVGQPTTLPAFNLPDINGKIVRSADLLGNVLILRFWATW